MHATEVTLDTLDEALDAIVAGAARGRWMVRIGESCGGLREVAPELREAALERPPDIVGRVGGDGSG